MINPICTSSYLAFRHVVNGEEWIEGVKPTRYDNHRGNTILVNSADDIHKALKKTMSFAHIAHSEKVGLLLSRGIDSGMLAAFMPKGSYAFTIDFPGIVESYGAKDYAERNDLRHYIINATWANYKQHELFLMLAKQAPLHPVEVPLFMAARLARQLGVETLIVGNGADSNFGGLDKLLAKDWSFDEFVERYNFIEPTTALKDCSNVRKVYEPYRQGDKINYLEFLNEVHGDGITQAFSNAICSAGLNMVAPYEQLALKKDGLDIERIRAGEAKYLLYELFNEIYPNKPAPAKVAFARPMERWMRDYKPQSDIFVEGLDSAMELFSGEQKYLLRSLEKFLKFQCYWDNK